MKIFLRNCSVVLLIIGLYTTGYTAEQFPFLAVVSKSSVNLRAGANTNFEKIDQLKQGDEIIVLGKVYDWYKVQLPVTAKAFVRADYLEIQQDSLAAIIGNNVNIRAAANSDSASLGILKKGETVKTVILTNGWWQIQPPAQAVGWVREDFLSFKTSHLEMKPKIKAVPTVEIKGKLVPLLESQEHIRYQLLVDGQVAYYVQSVPDIDRFKGAFVSIKGLVASDQKQLSYPVLHTINISLLL